MLPSFPLVAENDGHGRQEALNDIAVDKDHKLAWLVIPLPVKVVLNSARPSTAYKLP